MCFVQQNSPIEFGQLYEKKIRKLQQAPRRHRPLTHTALFTLTAPSPPSQAPPSAAPVRRCRPSRYTIPPRDATRARHSALMDSIGPIPKTLVRITAYDFDHYRYVPDYNEFGFSYHEEVFKFYNYVQKEYVQPAFNMDSSTVIAVRRTTGPIRQARARMGAPGRIGA